MEPQSPETPIEALSDTAGLINVGWEESPQKTMGSKKISGRRLTQSAALDVDTNIGQLLGKNRSFCRFSISNHFR
jgi:hypothetical protein